MSRWKPRIGQRSEQLQNIGIILKYDSLKLYNLLGDRVLEADVHLALESTNGSYFIDVCYNLLFLFFWFLFFASERG